MILKKIRYIIGLLSIWIIIWFLSIKPEILKNLQQISWRYSTGLIILSVLIMIMLGLIFKHLISMFGLNLSIREWLGLTSVNTMCNYYLPTQGGLIVRGAYLKRQYNFPFSRYASLVMISQLLMIGVIATFGMFFLIINIDILNENTFPLFFLFGIVLIITLLSPQIMLTLAIKSKRFGKIKPFLQQFIKGLEIWRQHRVEKMYLSLLMVIVIFLWGFKLYICFMAIGEPVNFGQIMIIQTLINFSLVISITPGNLGIKEGITAFSANLFGISPTTALLASLVDRAIAVLVVFSMGMVFSHILIRELKS